MSVSPVNVTDPSACHVVSVPTTWRSDHVAGDLGMSGLYRLVPKQQDATVGPGDQVDVVRRFGSQTDRHAGLLVSRRCRRIINGIGYAILFISGAYVRGQRRNLRSWCRNRQPVRRRRSSRDRRSPA